MDTYLRQLRWIFTLPVTWISLFIAMVIGGFISIKIKMLYAQHTSSDSKKSVQKMKEAFIKTIKRYVEKVIVFIFSYMFIYTIAPAVFQSSNDSQRKIISIAVGLFVSYIYSLHNKQLSSHMVDKVTSEVVPNILPTYNTIQKIPGMKEYVLAYERDINGHLDHPDFLILKQTIFDITKLAENNKYLIRFDAYLRLLTSLVEEHDCLHCINKTLPIFWISHENKKGKLLDAYEKELFKKIEEGKFKVFRVTTVKSKDILKKQFKNAVDELERKYPTKDNLVFWYLTLIQQFCRHKNCPSNLDETTANQFDDSKERMLQILRSPNLAIEDFFSDQPMSHSMITKLHNFIQRDVLTNSSLIEQMDRAILSIFHENHKRHGSFYLQERDDTIIGALNIAQNKEEPGEIAVYSRNGVAKKAIATFGDVGSYICIGIVKPDEIYTAVQNCFNKIETYRNEAIFDMGGNIQDLL